jgi:hypothetical protein
MALGGGFNHFGRIRREYMTRRHMVLDYFQGEFQSRARQRAPRDQGDLIESIQSGPGSHQLERRVNVGAEYGAAQEYGAGPHEIRAKNASVLTNGGGEFFGPVVQHPGNDPHPFMKPTEQELDGPFKAAWKQAIEG